MRTDDETLSPVDVILLQRNKLIEELLKYAKFHGPVCLHDYADEEDDLEDQDTPDGIHLSDYPDISILRMTRHSLGYYAQATELGKDGMVFLVEDQEETECNLNDLYLDELIDIYDRLADRPDWVDTQAL